MTETSTTRHRVEQLLKEGVPHKSTSKREQSEPTTTSSQDTDEAASQNLSSDKDEGWEEGDDCVLQHPWARIVTPDEFASDDEEEEEVEAQESHTSVGSSDKAKGCGKTSKTTGKASTDMTTLQGDVRQMEDLDWMDRSNPFIGMFRHAPKATLPASDGEAAKDKPEEGEEAMEQNEEMHDAFTSWMCPYPVVPFNFGCLVDDSGFTVMVRNIPNRYSRDEFVKELETTGFQGTFDFAYLPIDPVRKINKGYAFVNFINTYSAHMFMAMYKNRKMNFYDSDKRVTVLPADLQGFEANYAHFSGKYISEQDEAMRPLFLREMSNEALQAARRKNQKGLARKKKPPTAGPCRPDGRVSLIDRAARDNAALNRWLDQSSHQSTWPTWRWSGMDSFGEQDNCAEQVPAEGFKLCTHCGVEAEVSFRFCHACGKSME